MGRTTEADEPLPVLNWDQVAELKSKGRLVFVINDQVHSVDEEFVHPGGAEILAEYSGTDITDVFNGDHPSGHAHNASAVHLLSKFRIGRLPPNATAPTPPQPQSNDFNIDESKPLLWQVGALGPRYMEWVESPVPGHPRFFEGSWAEAVTKTPWWVVPLLWLPFTARFLLYAFSKLPFSNLLAFLALGVILWQALEYSLHRFLFHLHPTTPLGIFLHFLIHGCHHKYPMDTERLVFPPIPASWIVAIVYSAVHAAAPEPAIASAVFSGIMLGYVAYDCMHYWMHSGVLGGTLRWRHMRHHYVDSSTAYGISSPLFDVLLRSMAVK